MQIPYEYELSSPIQLGDDQITKIVIKRKPIAKDLLVMDRAKGDVAKVIALIERLSDEPAPVIGRLDASDFTRLSEIISDFLS